MSLPRPNVHCVLGVVFAVGGAALVGAVVYALIVYGSQAYLFAPALLGFGVFFAAFGGVVWRSARASPGC